MQTDVSGYGAELRGLGRGDSKTQNSGRVVRDIRSIQNSRILQGFHRAGARRDRPRRYGTKNSIDLCASVGRVPIMGGQGLEEFMEG